MHELSLIDGIISQVNTLKEKHGFQRVKEIEIICGQHHAINSENLEFFLGIQDDLCFKQAQIRLVRLVKKHYCVNCELEFDGNKPAENVCERCQSGQAVLASRSVMNIRKLEVD